MSGQKNDGESIFLKDAYALENTDDSLELYDKWAENYDETFAKANDYNTPDLIADLYAENTRDKNALVLDIGAGTGLVAEGLTRRGISHVDALDISEKMLSVARRKGVYQRFVIADLNQPLDIPDATYAGFTCTGTFTHGHVGPDALDELVRIGATGALYVLGIKASIYESAGFAAKFQALSPQFSDFRIVEKQGYGENADKSLQASTTAVAVFRKA